MIYDCFMFFNELDLLEVRLNELYRVVDKFILVEATKTHTNKDKPLFFNENKNRYLKFLDKIDHVIIDEYPEFDSAWAFENYQRNVIIDSLKERCKPDDVILISDLDEIPKSTLVEKYRDTKGIKIFDQALYTFYFNYLNSTDPVWKKGTRMLRFSDISDKTLTDIRFAKGEHIKDAGWHFTYLGGLDMVKQKIKSFAHQEYNNDYYMNESRLKKLISDGIDIFERGYKYKIVNIDSSFPDYVIKNQNKFKHLIFKKSSLLHRVKNLLIKPKRQDKRYIETYQPINSNPITDFISPSSKKIIEIGQSNNLKNLIEKKFEIEKYLNIDIEDLKQIHTLEDNYYDCVVLDKTLTKLFNPQEVLSTIRKKLNRNGYVIMNVSNFRYIKTLNQILFKKTFSTRDIRVFTRKSLFELISSSGYYTITFKGLKPDNSFDYKLKNCLLAGNLYDSKHEEFLIVLKS